MPQGRDRAPYALPLRRPRRPPVERCYVGLEASDGFFCFDPRECYTRGVVTSPNIVVIGQIGRGKSAFLKSLLWRE